MKDTFFVPDLKPDCELSEEAILSKKKFYSLITTNVFCLIIMVFLAMLTMIEKAA